MKKNLNVSELLEIQNPNHALIDFVDINVRDDQKLFIDPCLLSLNRNDWCNNAEVIVNSFFDEFYKAYREDNYRRKIELLAHSREVNCTKLGYGNGVNGHGNTAEGLSKVFKGLEKLIKDINSISNVIDLPVLIYGFNEDGLSDMITNIIHKQLNDYTLAQISLYGKYPNSEDEFYTWDISSKTWVLIKEPCYEYNGKKILLTPKRIVRKKYVFSADHFLRSVILEREKNASAQINDKGKTVYTTTKKDLIKKIEKKDEHWRYKYVVERSKKEPQLLNEYHATIKSLYIGKQLDDSELDKLIYQKE